PAESRRREPRGVIGLGAPSQETASRGHRSRSMRGRRGTVGTPKKRDWKPAFVAALRDCGVVRYACTATGVPHTSAYRARVQDEGFRRDWAEALEEACDLLEAEAHRRAVEGVGVPVFHKGEICGHVRTYSDTLLIFLLKGYRPERFRDRV